MILNLFLLNCRYSNSYIMASFKDSFYGKLSGKVGSITTYVINGVQVVRANTVPRDPKTPKQLAHRMKFGLVNSGLSPLNSAIKLGYRGDRNAYRTLVGKVYREAVLGEYPNLTLDYSKIKIAEGCLQPPADISIEFDAATNIALFSWDAQISEAQKRANVNDQVNIVVLNEKYNAVNHISEVAKRKEGAASIAVPNGWKPAHTHFWLYFSSHTLQMNSESVYVKLIS